jgi:hypothetical protein
MKNKNVVITAICLAVAFIWALFSNRRRKRNEGKNIQREQQTAQSIEKIGSEYPQNVPIAVELEEEREELCQHSLPTCSPLFKEAIKLAIEECPENREYFYHPEETVNDIFSSLHPVIRILPCNRVISDSKTKEKVRTKRLDILFPIPLSMYMKKHHLDMGLYYKATGLKKLPGNSIKFNLKVFDDAFRTTFPEGEKKLGYAVQFLWEGTVPCYPKADIEVKREGYFNVSYLVLDPVTQKYVRRHKYVNVTYTEAARNLKDSRDSFDEFLTESYEKYVLFDPDDDNNNGLVDIPEDIIDFKRLDRSDAIIAKEQTEVDDVILAYRVSFFLAEEDYPSGITPLGLSRILNYLMTNRSISEKYNDPEEKVFKYLTPWIIEERPKKRGELNVLSLVEVNDEESELQSIPIVNRDKDQEVEKAVNEIYFGE